MELRFYGAVRSVTGSMHMLARGDTQVLLECGLYQGKRKEAIQRNKHFPFDPARLSTCVLSHAHIDHSGNLPNLVKQGYKGPIWATPATADLARALLEDSAYIQERDAEFLNRKAERRGEAPVEPLYSREDAREASSRFRTVDYGQPLELAPGVRASFYDAGHILGSAVTVYEVDGGGRTLRVGFTGDLGRPHHPILRDPQRLPRIDYLITESTYGNRLHEAIESMKERLHRIVHDTVERGGRLIIPAFSVGRTQNLVYYLAELFHEGRLPPVKVFVDSPLAIEATHVYRDHPECYDRETLEMLANDVNPFGFGLLTYTRSQEESMALNTLREPCIVIAASGMCEGGRILHHLKHGVGDPDNTVLIVGFQAQDTLGRKLVEGAPKVRIYGEEHRVRCHVETMNGLSAHADRDELSAYIKNIPGLQKVFVVHGEEEASLGFAAYLMRMKIPAYVPTPGEKVEL